MRNFYRDFEALNEAYNCSIQQKQPHQVVHESVSSDIDNMYRESSRKQLREALKKIADVHTKDQSSLTYEDCMNEMKMYAEEQMQPVVPTATPVDPLHNTPVNGLANEESKPDYIDADGDGDKEEPMKKALKDKEDKPTEESSHDHEEDEEEATEESSHEDEEDEDKETVEEQEMTFEEQLAFIRQLEEEDHENDEDEEEVEEASGDDMVAAAQADTLTPQLVNTAKTLAGGKGRAGMMGLGRNPEKKVQTAYGSLMGKVADKLDAAIKQIDQPGV